MQIVDDVDGPGVCLVDEQRVAVEVVAGYLRYLTARGCSPNTVRGYACDLLHLWRFLEQAGLAWDERPRSAMDLLIFLRSEPIGLRAQRSTLSLVGRSGAPGLSASTINRILTGVCGFSEWAIAAELFDAMNPIQRRLDPAWRRVTDRHRPFVGEASRQSALRRTLKVRQPRRLPRPFSEEQVAGLLGGVGLSA